MDIGRYLKMKPKGIMIKRGLTFCLGFLMLTVIAYGNQITASVVEQPSDVHAPTVSVHFKNKPLPDVLDELARKVHVGISYETDIVSSKLVTYQADGQSIFKVLDDVLEGTGLFATLSQNKKVLLIKKKKEPDQKVTQSTVTGTVTDGKTGKTLPGVNILVKGTTNGTTTDENGTYKLQVESLQDTLEFSFIGYKKREVPIRGRTTINVALKVKTVAGEEVVVVGYGQQKQKTLTSSISSVDSKAIQNTPVASSNQMIEGKIAGVNVSNNSGTPGGGISINVRGSSSITGGNKPLYVVDGVPIQSGTYGLGTGGGQTNPLSFLDPSNIKSIEVLKDASATAIYGARASNGVVLITTKRGAKSDSPRIEISSYFGFQNPVNTPDLVNGSQYEMLQNEAARNNGQAAPYPNPQSAISTDWASKVFRTAGIRKNRIALSGGNENIKYAISGSNYREEGTMRPTAFERSGGRVNIDLNATDNLRFGTSTRFSYSNRTRTRNNDNITGVLAGAYFYPPNLPVYHKDGSYQKYSIFENPVAAVTEVDFNMDVYRFVGSAFGEYDIAPNLTLRTSWSYDYNGTNEDRYNNSRTVEGSAVNGSATSSRVNSRNWNGDATLKYQFQIGQYNNFKALLGSSIEKHLFEQTTASGQQFPSDAFHRIEAAAVQTSSTTGTTYGLASFFGRLKYDYDGTYLATITFRRDGSSRFGAKNKWGNFPSIALGWVPTEEPFFNVSWINNLKLRASYGQTGNQSGIGNFQALGLWNGSSYTDHPGTSPQQLANPSLKWETTNQLDVGIDMSLLEDRLSISYDYYYKKTDNLLLDAPIPMTNGFRTTTRNTGAVQNQGMEFSLTADIIQKPSFSWEANFDISGNRNKILDLVAPFNVYNRDIYRYKEGIPMYSFYMHHQLGVDPQTGAPIFEDVNGDGVFDPNEDRTIVGNANPDFFGGLSNNLSYKNFDLSVFIQYKYGNDELNWNRFFQEHGGTRNTNFLSSQLNRWQEPGDQTMVPKMTSENYASNLRPSRFVEDGSYIRLKSATIGYTLPRKWFGGHISNFRIYITGHNLLTITNYSGLDPEVTATASTKLTKGIEFYTPPENRSIIGGFDITF